MRHDPGVRASRLVTLLFTLQRRRGATAAELARELEVSERTIYRDVAALTAAGVPLFTEPGPGGGIRLVDGWRTRLDGLTGPEAAALFAIGAPQVLAELGMSAALAGAQAKLLATLPEGMREQVQAIAQRFHLDAPGWFHAGDDVPHLATVADAVWADRRLDVRYGRPGRDVARRLDPLGLVLKGGTWYLVAAHRGRPRTWRISRFTAAAARPERVRRPPGFDLAAWWAAASADFDRSIRPTTIRLRLSAAAAANLRHAVGHVAAAEAAATAGPPDGDGWREVTVAVESEEVAAFQLTSLGAGVEVLAPASLRARMAATGAAMAARNAPVP